MAKGVSLLSANSPDKQNGVSLVNVNPFDIQKGASIVSINSLDRQKGNSLVSTNNLFVLLCTIDGNPLVGTITVSGGLDIDGVYTGFDDYPFTTSGGSGINFEASAPGYVTNSVQEDVNQYGYQEIKIFLEPDVVVFSCTTLFKNQFGVEVSKPLRNGFVEVTFSGSTDFDYTEYSTLFEAIPVGSNKYNSIVLDGEVIDSSTDYVTYKLPVVQQNGDFCYLSNITKNEC